MKQRLYFVAALCVIVAALLACSSTTTSSSGNGTPQPTKTWQQTQTFPGNGAKKTETFSVSDDWKIQWSCKGNVEFNIDAPLYITVYNADTKLAFDTPSTTCKASDTPTTGETEEHQGGNVYLDVNAGIEWTITIQELK